MKKLIIFDVDGTLTQTQSKKAFREDANDWQWIPGRLERCLEIVESSTRTALASNQGGVCFEWSSFTQAEMEEVLSDMCREMKAIAWQACFTIPNPKALPGYFNENDPRRKPNPGMLMEIMEEFGISKEDTMYVGDREEDKSAAENAGVAFEWADAFFA